MLFRVIVVKGDMLNAPRFWAPTKDEIETPDKTALSLSIDSPEETFDSSREAIMFGAWKRYFIC